MLSRTTILSRRSWLSVRKPRHPEVWSSRFVGEAMGRPTTPGNPSPHSCRGSILPSWSTSATLRAHLEQVPLNYPSETLVQPSSTAHFHYGFPTVEPLSRYSNKLLSSNLKTAIFQPCKRCHTP